VLLKQKPDKKCKAFFVLNHIFVSNVSHFLSVFQISFLFHPFGKELLRFFCFTTQGSKTIKIDEKKEKIRQSIPSMTKC